MSLLASEITLIRFKTGDSEPTFPEDIINSLFAEAAVTYASYSRSVQKQAVIVERYRNLVASHRQDVTYKQNETSENMSDIAKGYAQDLEREETKLNEMISSDGISSYIVATRKAPSRNRDMP